VSQIYVIAIGGLGNKEFPAAVGNTFTSQGFTPGDCCWSASVIPGFLPLPSS
jgi:hypothetical protein